MDCSRCADFNIRLIELEKMLLPLLTIINELKLNGNNVGCDDAGDKNMVIDADVDATKDDGNSSPVLTDVSGINSRPRGLKRQNTTLNGEISNAKQIKSNDGQPIPVGKLRLSDLIAKVNDKGAAPKTNNPNVAKVNTRSLYLSPFDVNTTPAHIIQLLNENETTSPFTEKLSCVSLMPNKRRFANPSFISFKLDVPTELYTRFSDENLWHGLTVKEFVVKQNQNPVILKSHEKASPKPQQNVSPTVSKSLPNRQNKSNDRSKPKNGLGNATIQRSKLNVTEKQRAQRNRRHSQANFCRKSCCPHSQPKYNRNACIDYYAGHQYGNHNRW